MRVRDLQVGGGAHGFVSSPRQLQPGLKVELSHRVELTMAHAGARLAEETPSLQLTRASIRGTMI